MIFGILSVFLATQVPLCEAEAGAALPATSTWIVNASDGLLPMLPARAEQGGLWRGQVRRGARIALNDAPVAVATDGHFVLGFDRDQSSTARLTIIDADGRSHERAIAVQPRAWRTQRVNVARGLPREGDESWTRREAEVLRAQAARARCSQTAGWRNEFIWPARGRISGRFGSQRIYRGEPGRNACAQS